MSSTLPQTPTEWRQALSELPATPNKIPAFFFAHGSPVLAFSDADARAGGAWLDYLGPRGPLAVFLRDFGPALLEKYRPKGIAVFSAHWETHGERLVSDYGAENPLFMDYYGFKSEYYDLKFKSRGDTTLARRIVELYKEAGQAARLSPKEEVRGRDGRGLQASGFDHGVFIPFRLMFGETFTDIPIVEVSIDSSLDPERNWALGKAVAKLREEGTLVLSGGLTVHNLRERSLFNPDIASTLCIAFNKAVYDAASISEPEARKKALVDLVKHPGFSLAHPRADHFVPLYVAAGAGEEGGVKVLAGLHGAPTIAFGL